ncbi:YbdD/YjiX family protein [Actinomyces lilanjuaniae]|uniref:YbdD/YjiX family protein n=1 Tax=Actinomyces lilanjuaniae TaxID=2321394 RepID=UPI00242A669C|nr:YbdD/YjiX family protein [Actinomyces lilanjuaniae]
MPRLHEVLSRARRLWRDMTGESAYERYLQRHCHEHPDCAPMGEHEFWRARAQAAEEKVSTGCC